MRWKFGGGLVEILAATGDQRRRRNNGFPLSPVKGFVTGPAREAVLHARPRSGEDSLVML